MSAEYEYVFTYVRGQETVNKFLDDGWEPIPHVVPVTIPPGAVTTTSVYIFLRREKK